MAGFVLAIHVSAPSLSRPARAERSEQETWIPTTSAGMTVVM